MKHSTVMAIIFAGLFTMTAGLTYILNEGSKELKKKCIEVFKDYLIDEEENSDWPSQNYRMF